MDKGGKRAGKGYSSPTQGGIHLRSAMPMDSGILDASFVTTFNKLAPYGTAG